MQTTLEKIEKSSSNELEKIAKYIISIEDVIDGLFGNEKGKFC